jgi:hypothetical protein
MQRRSALSGTTSRRDALKMAGALAGTVGLGAFASRLAIADSAGKPIAGFDAARVPSAQALGAWLRQLHDFGPIRATGTPQCRAFEEWLAGQFGALGFSLQRDQYRLTSWECDLDKDCSLSVVENGGAKKKLGVVAYFPFAASTRTSGPVSGRILYGGVGEDGAKALVGKTPAAQLAESIVVLDMPLPQDRSSRYKLYPGAFPATLPRDVSSPSPSAQGGRGLMELLQDKCKGLVLCYVDVTDEAARYNYLPFSEPHRKIPALWVGLEGSRYLQSVSGKATLTMRCDATLTPNARADSIVATLPGASDEVIFVTTHTDGPNEVNDNGALGVLALATYAAKTPARERRRTLVASLPTGHYAAGAIADPTTGSGERAGTRGVMTKHPDIVKRIVGQIALEQLGAMEWADVDGKWQATGQVANEYWIPTPATAQPINRMFLASTHGLDPKYSRSVLVESGFAPGEGGAPRAAGLPGIGLMGAPYYFFRCDPKGVIDKLNPKVMFNQVNIATRLMVLMDRLSVAQLKGEQPIADADLFGAS